MHNLSPFLLAALALAAGCSEIPQDAAKSFAGPAETKGHLAKPFTGDKDAYEKALAARAAAQDEYPRLRNANP